MSERRPAEEVVPPQIHIRQAGHHWLREYDSDGHFKQTIVCQWQPHLEKWCHSGAVATGHEIDTTYWEYEAPCPMPSSAVVKNISLANGSVWNQIMPTEAEALYGQLHSMLYRELQTHFKKVMEHKDQQEWLAAQSLATFPHIDELSTGQVMEMLIRFGKQIDVSIG